MSQKQDELELRNAVNQHFRDVDNFFKRKAEIEAATASAAPSPAKGKSPFDAVKEVVDGEVSRSAFSANVATGKLAF